jgi:hypothetical protein
MIPCVHQLGTPVLNFKRPIAKVENITISFAHQPQVRVFFVINSNKSCGERTLDRYFLSRIATRLSSESVTVFKNDWFCIWLTARARSLSHRSLFSISSGRSAPDGDNGSSPRGCFCQVWSSLIEMSILNGSINLTRAVYGIKMRAC